MTLRSRGLGLSMQSLILLCLYMNIEEPATRDTSFITVAEDVRRSGDAKVDASEQVAATGSAIETSNHTVVHTVTIKL